jgi:glutathione S-transferase
MAIARYCAKITGLDGEGNDWATSEMMLEEHNDIFDLFNAAKYRHAQPDSQEAWDKCVKVDVPKHLAMLETKITESGFFGSKMCAGDIAICSVINFGLDSGLDLAPFPKIGALYASVCLGSGPVAAYIAEATPPYFKRP